MTPVDSRRLAEELTFGPGEQWWRPTILDHPDVRGEWSLPARVTIVDETLREGEETPGVYLDLARRTRVAELLEEAGVPEIEIGYVGAIPEHAELSRALKQRGTRMTLMSHTRTYTRAEEWRVEIDQAIDAGSDVLCLLASGSHTLSATTPWLPLEAVPDRVAEAVRYTLEQKVVPHLALVDGIRTPLTWFDEIHRAAADAGVRRVYVMDGQGVAVPEVVRFLVRRLRALVGQEVEIAVHCHDDYGMATANTLAGVTAGASATDVVVNGLGDKAGIGALEEVVMALEVLYGVKTGIVIDRLYDLSRAVAEIFDVPLEANKAIVGENVVRHQIDSHIATVLRGIWWAWEEFRPEIFGRRRSLEWAKGKVRVGRSGALAAKVEAMGLVLTQEEWDRLGRRVREEVEANNMLTEEQVESLVREVRGSQTNRRG
jgi:isopropylmalate/homocitrate/citramalate synthase